MPLKKRQKLPKYVVVIDGIWHVRRNFPTQKRDDKDRIIYDQVKRRCEFNTEICAAILADEIEQERLKPASGPSATVIEFITHYLTAKKPNVSRRVFEANEDYIERYVKNDLIAQMAIRDVTARDIQLLYARANRTPSVIRKLHKFLSAAFNQGMKWGDLSRNPCIGVLLPKEVRGEIEVFDRDQARAFMAECQKTDANIVLELALELGARPQEYLALSWSHISGTLVHIKRSVTFGLKGGGFEFGPTKTKASTRTVDISRELQARLRVHKSRQAAWVRQLRRNAREPLPERTHSDYDRRKASKKTARETLANIKQYDLVFPSSAGTPMSINNLNKWKFQPMVKSLGLDPAKYSAYTLRHTAITLLLADGVDVKTIAERHGTSPEMIWNTYGHVLASMRGSAAAKMAAALYQ